MLATPSRRARFPGRASRTRRRSGDRRRPTGPTIASGISATAPLKKMMSNGAWVGIALGQRSLDRRRRCRCRSRSEIAGRAIDQIGIRPRWRPPCSPGLAMRGHARSRCRSRSPAPRPRVSARPPGACAPAPTDASRNGRRRAGCCRRHRRCHCIDFGRKCSRFRSGECRQNQRDRRPGPVRIWPSSIFFRAAAKSMVFVQPPEKSHVIRYISRDCTSNTMPTILTRTGQRRLSSVRRVSWRGSVGREKRGLRQKFRNPLRNGAVAEWLCRGLQSLVRRFDSGPRLHVFTLIRRSSMVEHAAVNRRVVGSSPTAGANSKSPQVNDLAGFFLCPKNGPPKRRAVRIGAELRQVGAVRQFPIDLLQVGDQRVRLRLGHHRQRRTGLGPAPRYPRSGR